MADYASEQGHWYDKDGTPKYTYINKKGEEKPTTLREARKHGWYPGTTSILKLAAQPGLDVWKQDQTILACLTMPRIESESEADYIKRLKEDARSQAKKAAEKGKEIHGYIERGFMGDFDPPAVAANVYYASVFNTIVNECTFQDWHSEKSFASSLGYGGKVDLHNDLYLIDFKTTEKDLETIKTWDEMAMQLSAYHQGLDGSFGRKCGICYVHVKTAESRLIWIEPEDIRKGWDCFRALLDFYYAKTGLVREIIH